MTCDRRLLLLLILPMAYGFFVVEGRYRQHEDTAIDGRHRHRHRHESATSRRNHHDPGERIGASSWSQELEYEDDAAAGDREERDNEDEEDDDYDTRPYYERSYPRSSRGSYHGRIFEPRHSARYHRGGYRGSGWYDEDNEKRHGAPSRYAGRNHRARAEKTRRRIGYGRNREASDLDYDVDEEEYDYERPLRYEEESEEKHHAWWWNGRKQRINQRRDWRSKTNESRRRHYANQIEASRRAEDWWRRSSNATESKFSLPKNDRRKNEEGEDYDYRVDEIGFDENEKEDEEDDIWKEADSEDESENENENENEDEEELDNDFYKAEKKAPLKTYDDIIRRLTSDDPTTLRPTFKRDYRNIELDKYMKRDAFGNFRYEPKTTTRPPFSHDHAKTTSPPRVGATAAYHSGKKTIENSLAKSANSPVDRRLAKDAIGIVAKGNDRQESRKAAPKIDDTRTKTKSLEQDYDEYMNTPDNEKEEDLIKAGVEEDSGMQADVTNTDYTEDDNPSEDETPATLATSTIATTTTSTTTTTTTPRPVVTQHYDYRDPKAYEERNTGTQYNGYQSRSDYPPMSAHSVHKWQSLGTRESVKETRSNMQQYNKNGKSAEIREALQHAIKVSREGSCQWPRPRVIPVRDVYPSPSTTYIPHCAILHRCSDDTGCCRSEALTCVPKHSHRVELSFYTTNVGGSSVVEKLSFYNHTECECRERTEHDATNEKPSEQRVYRHYQSPQQPQNMRRAQPRKPCRCPSEFTPRITPEGECQCNCYENHQNCIKTRRGKGYFSLADRLCIQNEECASPSCEFGEYMRRQGKCPRKKDKFDAIASYRTNLSHRYRS